MSQPIPTWASPGLSYWNWRIDLLQNGELVEKFSVFLRPFKRVFPTGVGIGP
mgnify:CR=1 FL=1